MDQSNRNGSNATNAVAALSSIRQQITPPYMKLIADCWEHILDYLRFEDMGSLAKTCKRMHQMVTYYLRENFPNTQFMLIGKEVHLEYYYFSFPVEFSRFVSTLCISHGEWDYLLDAAVFHSLKTLMFRNIVIGKEHVRFTQAVLHQIEKLDFTKCSLKHEVFEPMIDLCRPKLKTLTMDGCRVTGPIFLQHYPALEDLKFIASAWNLREPIPEIKIFLEKHTELKLKRFESDHRFLWMNRNIFNETNARLDQLIVHFYEYDDEIPFDQFIDFLKNLHAHEFIKTLHLVFKEDPLEIDLNFQELLRKLSTLASTLTGLSLWYPFDSFLTTLSSLINLNEIHFQELCCNNAELEIIAKGLAKLEKLTIYQAHDGQIELFVRHSKKLKTMKIHEYLSDTVIDLFKLNNDRKELENANRIEIFTSEYIYLPLKWNSKHLNLDLVKISRIDPIF